MKRILLLLICLLLSSMLSAEIRAVWATSWNLDTPAKIDELIEAMITNKQNTIMAEVRYRADALYTPNKQDKSYPNSDPKSYLLANKDFDALSYLLARSQFTDIRVHAWLPMIVATPTDMKKLDDNHIYYTHPEWFTCEENGKSMNPISGEGLFLDPGIPEVREYLRNVVKDIAVNYPQIAGIHLDYIRYPGIEYGYHPVSVTAWKRYSGTEEPITWTQWKKNQITGLVKSISDDLRKISASLELSTAVVADYNRAIGQFSQEWHQWLERDIVDYVYPMAYSTNTNNVESLLKDDFNIANKDRIVIGLRAFNNSGSTKFPVEKVEHNILETQKAGYAGVCLFSYGDLVKEYFPRLLISCYSVPPAKLEPIVRKSVQKEEPPVIAVNQVEPESIPPTEPDTLKSIVTAEFNPSPISVEDPVLEPETKVEPQEEPAAIALKEPVETPAVIEEPAVEASPAYEEPTVKIIKGEDFTINFQKLGNKYKVTVNTDVSCHIEWKITQSDNYPLYSKYRWYPKGETVEIWDGQLDNSEYITPGIYTLFAFSEVHRKSIILKIRLQ
ncbi:MAG: family 10 glycosylhydrolase [Candidatus Cloacimonetes bacterium]|nr:family 10 glycosylhydrolase [Candidatus Cloacimonadota bacterium]